MGDEPAAEFTLEVLGDSLARAILAVLTEDSQSAKELADRLDISLPTVYRRIDLLEECDLVESKTFVSKNGNHYYVYRSNFTSAIVSLDDGNYDIQVFQQNTLPSRLSNLWDELRRDDSE